ncbi:MAG TPA: hypothetical protein VFH15_13060 [Pyrinomonadaceae bacterium]|nr:hypothetical protein [Pyrinomonadaceae bacterium]
MWNNLLSQAAIDQLLIDFGDFHDACLREISIATETYVADNLSMNCPPHLDTSVFLLFQRQERPLPAIEIKCEAVSELHFIPTADGCDSIISSGSMSLAEGGVRLAINFFGSPLQGLPGSSIFFRSRANKQPDLVVMARSVSWRSLEEGLGDALRYRQKEAG